MKTSPENHNSNSMDILPTPWATYTGALFLTIAYVLMFSTRIMVWGPSFLASFACALIAMDQERPLHGFILLFLSLPGPAILFLRWYIITVSQI